MLLKKTLLIIKKTKFKRLSNGRSAFLYSTNARLSSKISSMSLLQAGITKNRDFQTYIGLFKKNMFKCNEILMIGARMNY